MVGVQFIAVMRLRNVPGAPERIAASPFVEQEPALWKGRWRERFARAETSHESPLHIEIGTGKGQFLTTLALRHPHILFIGIEKFSSVLVRAVEKAEEMQPENLLLLRAEAELTETFFDKGEVNRIYLNFSDPWPKDRHRKRRLTSEEFLWRYEQILQPEGTIEFKTDNADLFAFSAESCKAAGWVIQVMTHDLHKDETLCTGNVMTEYEERFSGKGNPICKLIAKRP